MAGRALLCSPSCTGLFSSGMAAEWGHHMGFHRRRGRWHAWLQSWWGSSVSISEQSAAKDVLQAGQGVEPHSHFLIVEECRSLCLLELGKLRGGQLNMVVGGSWVVLASQRTLSSQQESEPQH